jgi:hypothetical protein
MLIRRSGLATAALASVAIAACGSSVEQPALAEATPAQSCEGFALSLSDRGGQPTPLAAAQRFVAEGGVDVRLPRSGWRIQDREAAGATVTSGDWSLHVLQGPDSTWQVDSGRRC